MEFSEKWGKDVEIATELALKELKLSIDEVDVTVLEEPSSGFLGFGSKLAKVRVEKKKRKEEKTFVEPVESKEFKKAPVEKLKNVNVKDEFKPDDLEEVNDHPALDFLKETTEKMGLKLNFKAEKNENSIYIEIEGKDAAAIIGKRGQTLDAIQYLTSLVVNKNKDEYIRVVIDARRYRKKREETLKSLAFRLSGKVKRNGRSLKLEPMNPYERMVIHVALQNVEGVSIRSEGEEPYRKVIIEPEKK